MRRAIHAALMDDPAVTAIVGARVYRDLGPGGLISREATPEAFNGDGEVLTSIVIRMGPRARPASRVAGGEAVQDVQLWLYDERSWQVLQSLARACRGVLDDRRDLVALDEPSIAWRQTLWASDGGEALDQGFANRPVLVSTYECAISETERTRTS